VASAWEPSEQNTSVSTCLQWTQRSKAKQSLYTSLDRPRGFQEVEAPRFQDSWHMKVVRLSALSTCCLYPYKIFLVFISLRGWVYPRVIMRPEGLSQWKIPITPPVMQSATFRLVVQWLHQLRHRVPLPCLRLPPKLLPPLLYSGTWSFKFQTLTPIEIYILLGNMFRIQVFQNQPSRTRLLYHKSASACTKIRCIFRPIKSASGEITTQYADGRTDFERGLSLT